MSLLEQKKILRGRLKERRALIPKEERHKKSRQISDFLHQIVEFKEAETVFSYISYLSEVETESLIDQFLEQYQTLAVPKIIDKTKMIAVQLNNRTELEPDSMGILTPRSDHIVTGPFDLALTPGVGFTATGQRLGYGRGYYDRWFSQNSVKTKIGLAFEIQLVDKLPIEETDIPLDIIVTEERIINLKTMKINK